MKSFTSTAPGIGAEAVIASVPGFSVLAAAIMVFSPDPLLPFIVMGTLTINPLLELDECTMRSSASAWTPLNVCSDGL